MSDRELLLRCDCGVEHLDVDLWLKPGIEGPPDDVFEESYLTIHAEMAVPRWRDRVRAVWVILRGRSYLFDSVILKPEDVGRLRDFARGLPGG